jgi:hypothetical protein
VVLAAFALLLTALALPGGTNAAVAGNEPIEVYVEAFIPWQRYPSPIPSAVLPIWKAYLPSVPFYFAGAGDGRGFAESGPNPPLGTTGAKEGTARTWTRIFVDPTADEPLRGRVEHDNGDSVGLSYGLSFVGGWPRFVVDESAAQRPSPSTRVADVRRAGGGIVVRIDTAEGTPLVPGAPLIDDHFTITLTRTADRLRYTVEGRHDGFPAHAVYVGGQLVYGFDPRGARFTGGELEKGRSYEQTAWSLAGAGEWEVREAGSIDTRTGELSVAPDRTIRSGPVPSAPATRRDDSFLPPPFGGGGAAHIVAPLLRSDRDASEDTGGVDFTSVRLRYVSESSDERSRALAYAFATKPERAAGVERSAAAGVRGTFASFFTWLLLDARRFWVNLHPSEPDRIIDAELGRTDAGRIMLEADFQLKKSVARLIHPDTETGKAFWDALGAGHGRRGSSATCLSFRQWIVPGSVLVRTTPSSIYVVDAPLDVKLEAEYLRERGVRSGADCAAASDRSRRHGERVYRRIVLPRLVQQVNEAPEYEALRRIFAARVIAEWYKRRSRTEELA